MTLTRLEFFDSDSWMIYALLFNEDPIIYETGNELTLFNPFLLCSCFASCSPSEELKSSIGMNSFSSTCRFFSRSLSYSDYCGSSSPRNLRVSFTSSRAVSSCRLSDCWIPIVSEVAPLKKVFLWSSGLKCFHCLACCCSWACLSLAPVSSSMVCVLLYWARARSFEA